MGAFCVLTPYTCICVLTGPVGNEPVTNRTGAEDMKGIRNTGALMKQSWTTRAKAGASAEALTADVTVAVARAAFLAGGAWSGVRWADVRGVRVSRRGVGGGVGVEHTKQFSDNPEEPDQAGMATQSDNHDQSDQSTTSRNTIQSDSTIRESGATDHTHQLGRTLTGPLWGAPIETQQTRQGQTQIVLQSIPRDLIRPAVTRVEPTKNSNPHVLTTIRPKSIGEESARSGRITGGGHSASGIVRAHGREGC